ncbi:small ubiquitin-like protein, partial [Aureobasidium namibiae CBS 147.97]
PATDRVQIVLKDQGGTQVAFGVKSNTRMEKVMNAYADRASRPVGALRFHFDGERVLPDDTTASLGMEQDDIIEVMTEQIGG